MQSVGAVPMIVVRLMKLLKQVTGVDYGHENIEWVLCIVLPNFSINKALQSLVEKHQYNTMCSQIDEVIDRKTFCELTRSDHRGNPCCPGESQHVIS